MTKKELAKAIAEDVGIASSTALHIVQQVFDRITQALVQEGRIELRNFGVFAVKTRQRRKARNPRTGAEVKVAAKRVVTFKPGREMKERIHPLKNVPGGGQ